MKTIIESTNINETNENEICMIFIQKYLHGLENLLKQHKIKLDRKKQFSSLHINNIRND
jgi:hypothetical protein